MSEIKVKFKPFGTQIAVAVPDIEEKTKGGLIKPDEVIAKEKKEGKNDHSYLKVIAIGNRVREVKVGDEIFTHNKLEGYKNVDWVEGTAFTLLEEDWIAGTKL